MRRLIQQFPKKGLLVLDETGFKLGQTQRTTVIMKGNQPFTEDAHAGPYAPRYDMIACIHFHGDFTPMIVTPEMRKEAGSQGITTDMLCSYITETLAPEVKALHLPRLALVLDQASIHSTRRIIEAFAKKHVHLEHVWKLPTASSDRVSPLDNTLFHQWKDLIRECRNVSTANIVEVMLDCWQRISVESIQHYYHLCGLTRSEEPLFDCPAPAEHQH